MKGKPRARCWRDNYSRFLSPEKMAASQTSLLNLNLQRFFRGEGPQPAPHTTHRRNVYILPTRIGLIFGLLLLVMLIGAINYANSMGFLFTFLLGSISMVAILHTYQNLLRLEIHSGTVPAVFSGELTQLPVILDNPGRSNRLALEVRLAGEELPLLFDAGVGQTVVHLDLPTMKRGRHPLPRFVLASRFPLGLFRAWTHVHLNQTYLVYPAPATSSSLPLPSFHTLAGHGDQGRGADDFAGLRTYHHGDSPRHIHWKALARQQGMLTKQFGGDRSEELWLDWQQVPGEEIEMRLSILVRWIIEAEREDLAYGLRLPATEIKPSRGPAHRHQCLEALALF